MQFRSTHARIAATGSAVPAREVANAELIGDLDTSDEWIRENLGIVHRRVATLPHESTAKLAARAASDALDAMALEPDDVGAIIVATATPDRQAPSTACLVQNELDVTNESPAFDVGAVCSGFIHALVIGASLIETTGVTNVVVIGADTFSTITDWGDRACVFFGDGAGAAVLQRDEAGETPMTAVLHADGRGHEGFYVAPGSTYTMAPRAVYEAGTRVLPQAIRTSLEMAGSDIEAVRWVIPHQPSKRVLDETARQLGVDSARLRRNFDRFANTAGASVPLLLDETNESGLLEEGDEIVFAAVGSGWTWGAAHCRWPGART